MPNKNTQKKSKKMTQRSLVKKHGDQQDISLGSLTSMMQQLNPNKEAHKAFLSPVRRADGRYVTSEGNLDRWIDLRIFRETQVKHVLRWLATTPPLLRLFFSWCFIHLAGMKLAYFDQEEDKHPEKIYKEGEAHSITAEDHGDFTVHNLGHATQLVQTSGMNILTDPVFGDLAPLFYPSMTKRFGRDIKPNQLPEIDVILISHNHRDHVDEPSLRKLVAIAKQKQRSLPQLLVPMGDEAFFRRLGFNDVRAFEWHEHITLHSKTKEPVTFCSAPADHRSGRTGFDAHQSLVSGWTISPKNRGEILYFAGDTARISDVRMESLALDIYHLYQHKKCLAAFELPKIINMEPGGPNYTRKDMKPTHQSAVDSIVSAFRLAIALDKVSEIHLGRDAAVSAKQWLNATATIFMHQNKFELGPDRFNENVFVFNRLLSYLKMNEDLLAVHEEKQRDKSKRLSLFHRHKGFIIDGVRELRALAQSIWPDECSENQNHNLIEFIQTRIHFPLINEKLSSENVFQFAAGQISTIVPDTTIPGSGKQKGEIENDSMRPIF